VVTGLMTIESCVVTLELDASVSRNTKLDVPARSGVPEITPDDWFTVNPSGKAPD